MEGLCECECGQETRLAQRTDRALGWVKGQPIRFVNGHNRRGARSEFRYHEEDRGFATSCWIWDGYISPEGYGRFGQQSGSIQAHRAVWERLNGPIPEGLEPDHLCRQRACVRPDHLELVTHPENVRRGANTKLTADEVTVVRQRRASGETLRTIAESFGVSISNVHLVASGKSWR